MQVSMNIANKYTVNIYPRPCISPKYTLNFCIKIHHYSIFSLNFRGQTGVTNHLSSKKNSRKTKVLRD